MEPNSPSRPLTRLRAAADAAFNGFPTTVWARLSGPGPESLDLHGSGGFQGLTLQPGADLTLRCELTLPETAEGVALAGDRLEATLFTLYPIEIRWNGETVFAEGGVPVAAGPALFTVIPALQTGANGTLECRIRIPQNQTTPWLNLKFTTPGLRARFEQLDVAWSQLALAEALAATPEDRLLVSQAETLVPDDLSAGDALNSALQRMAEKLIPFSERAANLPVHLIGHSHIDMNWLWTWPDTVEVIRRDFRSILALMDDYPELTFSHSQPAVYEVVRQHEPELFARVLEHIQSGRWEPTTMTWLEGDVNMASGEAHARQLLEGVSYTRDVLNATTIIFHAPDTFGHAGNLPQLAASAGATGYYHHRANPGQENQWPAYWWEGQDGTRLFAFSTYSYNGEIRARDLAFAAIRAHRFGHPAGLHFHGIGDHGGGPSRQNLDALRRFQKTPLLPNAFCSRMDAYMRAIKESGVSLPVSRGESRTIFEGCYTTHADTKYYNRTGENRLCTADTLAALAGLNHNDALTDAWRKVLFNQFHDILDGSAIHESYEKNRDDFEEVESCACDTTERALTALHSGLEPGQIAVTNPLSFDREDIVLLREQRGEGTVWLTDARGETMPGQYTSEGLVFVARVPAFATAAYRIETDARKIAALHASTIEIEPAYAPTDDRQPNFLSDDDTGAPYLRIETTHFRVYVRRDCGILVSFLDKRVGRELVGFGMRRGSDYIDTARPDLALNVFQLVEEHPHGMSAWQYQEVHSEQSLLRGATTRVVETGPVRCTLEVEHTLRASTIKQRIIFYRELPRIDFETQVDWQELGGPDAGVPNLKAAFTARLDDCEAWYETPFAAVRRPADGQEVPALRWADVGGGEYGFALINDSKYGYDALGCRLRLTLLRSGYDPDAVSDVGPHMIRYSLVPHPGSWRESRVVQTAAGFNQPLIARLVGDLRAAAPPSEATFRPTLSPGGSVQIACLKRARSGQGVIARLYESAGRTQETRLENLPAQAVVTETNIVEDRLRVLDSAHGSVSLTFRPWQVRTLLIETP